MREKKNTSDHFPVDIPIVFEDEEILCIDKPSGMTVNRSENAPNHTVQDWVETVHKNAWGEKNRNESDEEKTWRSRAGIVHRLDKETSGVLLIGKTPRAFSLLQKQFADRTVKKTYLALVHGMPSHDAVIRLPLARHPKNRRKMGVVASGREAETAFRVKSSGVQDGNAYALLDVEPRTGRMHQIRAHLKHAGYSIVGDPLYANRNERKQDMRVSTRMFLHAASIRFRHPETGEDMTCVAPLPHQLRAAIRCLNLSV